MGRLEIFVLTILGAAWACQAPSPRPTGPAAPTSATPAPRAATASGATHKGLDHPAQNVSPATKAESGDRGAGGVLARVNGAPITKADVRAAMDTRKRTLHGGSGGGAAVLEALITGELIAQKAESLGLQRDREYQQELERMRAQMAAFRRQRLRALYMRHLQDEVAMSEEKARAIYDRDRAKLGAQYHVMQILSRDEREIATAYDQLQKGKPFAEVAAAGFGDKVDGTPWDLGFLRWEQLPDAWRPALATLAPGSFTPILKGPRQRAWIVLLVAKREGDPPPFDTVKARIIAEQSAELLADRAGRLESELRTGATIERLGKE